MKNRKNCLLLMIILIYASFNLFSKTAINDEVLLVLLKPTMKEIKNIEYLYENDLMSINRLRLLGIYHESETNKYYSSFIYVKENNLYWIEFKNITGKAKLSELFKKNCWTQQFRNIFQASHGMIFPGGEDIPPIIYQRESLLITSAKTPFRTMYEVSFLFHLLGGNQNPGFTPFLDSRKDYPILAICLGAQTLNVACGGTLYQDIPMEIYGLTKIEQVIKLDRNKIHSSRYHEYLSLTDKNLAPAFHRIKIKKNSLLIRKMTLKDSDTPFVKTSHHQAIKKLGKDLVITATSIDEKVIEIIEHKKYENILGVQFHPESSQLYQKKILLKEKPGGERVFNPRQFLESNHPSMKFHRAIWKWFSQALNKR